MALKKTPTPRKAPAKPTAERSPALERVAVSSSNPSQLLREAAWSRMFGRTESKNPFTR
jgi:hypothetical protein